MQQGLKEIPFRVDMAGIIEILGGSLYSRRDTAVRELLQNAHDAVTRRRKVDLSYMGEIRLRMDEEANTLSVSDDGVGISQDEAEKYLGTLGLGISGLLKRESRCTRDGRDTTGIIGQFGVGLFSSFLLANRLVVESRKSAEDTPVRWEAGSGTSILLGAGSREEPGTTVTLHLSEDASAWCRDRQLLTKAVVSFADYLPVPIYLGDSNRRLNVMTPSWFEPTPDLEMVSMELEQKFDDTPLDVLVVRQEQPTPLQGALYITRQRTPGFSGRPLVTATVRRMVISSRIDGLFPEWGTFYRGALELPELQPTTSREDLIRDERFLEVRTELERLLLGRLRQLAQEDPVKLRAILTWHRYSFAGAALDEPSLRALLRDTYLFNTSQGPLTFSQIRSRSETSDPLEPTVQALVWFNTDRGQERWTNEVFQGRDVPCVQALRTFESTLLTLFAEDGSQEDSRVLVQLANPANEQFVSQILSIKDLHDVAPRWREFFSVFEVRVRQDSFLHDLPVLAFPYKSAEIRRDFQELQKEGTIPATFARMIERHFGEDETHQDQVILNTRHEIVARALRGNVHSPLASVLRLLVHNALMTAGASPRVADQEAVQRDLDWIAETISAGEGE